jgi:uncharacterized membrane protein
MEINTIIIIISIIAVFSTQIGIMLSQQNKLHKKIDDVKDEIIEVKIETKTEFNKLNSRIDKLEFELTYRLDRLENNNGTPKRQIKKYHYN